MMVLYIEILGTTNTLRAKSAIALDATPIHAMRKAGMLR